jgi:hypothetical protein
MQYGDHEMKARQIIALLFWGLVLAPGAALAAQGSGCMPTTGTVSGLTMAQDINSGIAALISSNSGASAPATDCTAASIKGQVWLDTSTTPNVLRQYDGASWVFLGALDSSNHLWVPPIGGGIATITAASTTDIWANVAASVTISGTTGVAALANADAVPGTMKVVTASGVFTMTNSTSLVLPSGANITTAVGDQFLAVALTNTNVAVFAYTRADGSSLVNPSVPLGVVLYGDFGTIPPKTVYGAGQALARSSYPAYLAAVTRAQTATLTAGNTTITSVGNTAGLGAGMPLEGAGIQSGTTISSVTSSTIIMSKTATANGAQTVTAFITGYGSGGDSTTVGVKDCQNRVLAGRDGTLGTLTNRLTSSYFGSNSAVINTPGGAESKALVTLNLPPYTPAGSVTVTTNPTGIVNSPAGVALSSFNFGSGSGNIGSMLSAGASASQVTSTGSLTGTAQGGTSTPFGTVQPTVTAECVVVVLP